MMILERLDHRIRFFIRPLPLGAVAIMALNDHYLKYAYGGFITGKLSDFCGVFYFPIFLLAVLISFDEIFKFKRFHLGFTTTISAIIFTDFLMLLIKLSPSSAKEIEIFFRTYLFQIQIVPDPSDLISFAMNPITYFYLKFYWTSSKET